MQLAFATATLLAIAAAAAEPPVASAPEERLARAQEHIEALDYLQALDELNDVISDEAATEEQLLEAHLWAGIVSRFVKNDVDARLHFSWVLKRRPQTELPRGQPPKVRILYEMIRDQSDPGPASSSTSPPPAAPTPAATTSVDPPTPEDDGSLPWVTLSGVGVGLLGAALAASGAALWGGGVALWAYGDAQPDQQSALQFSTPSLVGQYAGQAVLPVGVGVAGVGLAVVVVGLLVE